MTKTGGALVTPQRGLPAKSVSSPGLLKKSANAVLATTKMSGKKPPIEETPLDRVKRLCSLLAETAAPGTFLLNKACKTITKVRSEAAANIAHM
jgi:hypothetical protein